MKHWTFGLLLSALLLTAGCNTSMIRSTPPLPGQASASGRAVVGNIEASNTGLYLFYWLPAWSFAWMSRSRLTFGSAAPLPCFWCGKCSF